MIQNTAKTYLTLAQIEKILSESPGFPSDVQAIRMYVTDDPQMLWLVIGSETFPAVPDGAESPIFVPERSK